MGLSEEPSLVKIREEAADREGSEFAPAGLNESRSARGLFGASGKATGGRAAARGPPGRAKTANARIDSSREDNRHIHGGENTRALVVNTNVPALNAQPNLGTSGIQFARALQRLSSGMRVNSVADDAAGLPISVRLGAQVRGLNQDIRNANDGSE